MTASLQTTPWISSCTNDYSLLDSGTGEKLERIAGITARRPAPPAIWRTRQSEKQWNKVSSVCHRTKDGGGYWEHVQGEPKKLRFSWQADGMDTPLQFQLRFTSFGHCGVFFEQLAVWEHLYKMVRAAVEAGKTVKTVNLFGYTGCASLVMAAAGAEVFHVDSAKGVLDWGKANEKINPGLAGRVRWIHEDARAFLEFSQKRGFSYDGILADPPSWGHGVAKKDVWTFADNIATLTESCCTCINSDGFFLLTSHTHGVQAEALRIIVADAAGKKPFADVLSGDIAVRHANDDRLLPAGMYALGTNRM